LVSRSNSLTTITTKTVVDVKFVPHITGTSSSQQIEPSIERFKFIRLKSLARSLDVNAAGNNLLLLVILIY
jgi:hypothetical protein